MLMMDQPYLAVVATTRETEQKLVQYITSATVSHIHQITRSQTTVLSQTTSLHSVE